jgi:predicted lysophospholipase L1 biosynthesis ABC-type transport system permease subunit
MASDATHPLQVVGIAKDARYEDITGAISAYFYLPFLQHYTGNSPQSLELRTTGDPAAMIPEIERTIGNMAPNLPIFEVRTLRQALYSLGGLLIYQIAAAMAGVMGTLGLILAIIGVYGVLSYVVSQKTSEIGIRMALGAKREDILRMVYRQGLWIVGIGLAFGLAATLGIAHLLRSLIIVSATDPMTYAGVSAILLAIALLACYIPARRAMHVEPMQALRAE